MFALTDIGTGLTFVSVGKGERLRAERRSAQQQPDQQSHEMADAGQGDDLPHV
jgi:hypothetical protein